MALLYGQTEEFNPESEEVLTYLERIQLYFEANRVEDAKKVAVLLTVTGFNVMGFWRVS